MTPQPPQHIIGYASTPHRDRDGDSIIQSWPSNISGKPIRHMHNTRPQIGTILKSWTTSAGLLIYARILPQYVEKLHHLYHQGCCGLSVGILVKHARTSGGTRYIEGELIEVSVVRQPTNPYCRFQFTHALPDLAQHTQPLYTS